MASLFGMFLATETVALNPRAAFDLWTTLRIGVGSGPGSSSTVFWTGHGTVYEAYSGRTLAKFEGFDVARGVQLDDCTVRQFSRKLFWFRDSESNEILTEYRGQPVVPIIYDHQVFDYTLSSENTISASIVASERRIPVQNIEYRQIGDSCVLFQIPVFVDIGTYQAWEFYDYSVDTIFKRPETVLWCRAGSTPPFNSNNKAVMRFVGQRVETFKELPQHFQDYVNEHYPLFREPPLNMEEVQELQQAAANSDSQT